MRQRTAVIGVFATFLTVVAGASHAQTRSHGLAWTCRVNVTTLDLSAGRTDDDGSRRPWEVVAHPFPAGNRTSAAILTSDLFPVDYHQGAGPDHDTFLEGIDDEAVLTDENLLFCALDQPGYGCEQQIPFPDGGGWYWVGKFELDRRARVFRQVVHQRSVRLGLRTEMTYAGHCTETAPP